jgi:uncharacterized protein
MKYFATKISENIHKTPEGYLLCVGVPIGRVGEMEYGKDELPIEAGPNGIILVTRSEEELFSAATIASFEGKPFTIKHPEEFVDAENWKDLAKGHMMNVRRGEGEQKDDLVADIQITDAFTISLVEEGLRGLSCGYEAEYIQTGTGTWLQKKIVGNHLALVEEGRAGDSYQINDHKGVLRMSKKLADKIKAAFLKTVDEAVAEEKDKKESKDEPTTTMDQLVQMVSDMKKSMDAMCAKDEKKDPPPAPEKKAEDEDPEAPAAEEKVLSMEERMKALEAAVKQILENMAPKSEDEEESEEVEDEESEGEETDDEESDVVTADTGDTASRAEILAPGIKQTKGVKAEALKTAYKTKDGKKIIDALTASKPDFDNAAKVDMLFISASELLKTARNEQLSNTKKTRDSFSSAIFETEGHMTAEKMNELNKKAYGQK